MWYCLIHILFIYIIFIFNSHYIKCLCFENNMCYNSMYVLCKITFYSFVLMISFKFFSLIVFFFNYISFWLLVFVRCSGICSNQINVFFLFFPEEYFFVCWNIQAININENRCSILPLSINIRGLLI